MLFECPPVAKTTPFLARIEIVRPVGSYIRSTSMALMPNTLPSSRLSRTNSVILCCSRISTPFARALLSNGLIRPEPLWDGTMTSLAIGH